MTGIIVGIDGSDHSDHALEWAIREAAVRQAPLTVLTVQQPAVSTAPVTATIVLGSSNADAATVTGVLGVTPTGTVHFYVCGPSVAATACTSTAANMVDLGSVALTGSGNTATATGPSFTPSATGTYCFVGVYSGDSNYAGASDGSTTRECFTVTRYTPSVTTSPGKSSIVFGTSNTDTATVASRPTPYKTHSPVVRCR